MPSRRRVFPARFHVSAPVSRAYSPARLYRFPVGAPFMKPVPARAQRGVRCSCRFSARFCGSYPGVTSGAPTFSSRLFCAARRCSARFSCPFVSFSRRGSIYEARACEGTTRRALWLSVFRLILRRLSGRHKWHPYVFVAAREGTTRRALWLSVLRSILRQLSGRHKWRPYVFVGVSHVVAVLRVF